MRTVISKVSTKILDKNKQKFLRIPGRSIVYRSCLLITNFKVRLHIAVINIRSVNVLLELNSRRGYVLKPGKRYVTSLLTYIIFPYSFSNAVILSDIYP